VTIAAVLDQGGEQIIYAVDTGFIDLTAALTGYAG
jgi:hypothetical protein